MIIKGKSRASAGQAGNYLLDQKQNERVELIEIKGTLSDNVKDAMREWEAIAAGSRAEKPFYHASINPEKGVYLTPEQWEKAVDLLAKNLGLENCARVVVEHDKDGRTHRHILFNRVDPETGKAVRMSHNYRAHELTSLALAKEFGLNRPKGRHVLEEGEKPADRGPNHDEVKQSAKTGVKLYKWRDEIRDIYTKTLEGKPDATGQEIAAALEEKGHMIAKGDKVAFMILDPSGTPHRMAQSLGLKVKDLKESFSDIDPATLPNVEQARINQVVKQAEIARERERKDAQKASRKGAGMYDRESMASQQRDALRHAKDKQRQAQDKQQQERGQQAEAQQERPTDEKARADWNNAKNAQEFERKKQTEQEKPKGGAIGKEKSQGQQRAEDAKGRTEQTEAQRESQAKTAMREMFERKFGKGHGAEVLENWQNTRTGRERER